jgi:hypothetical protein
MPLLRRQSDFDQSEREGRLVGVFDNSTGDHLHLLPCAYVRGQHFYEKVVINCGKNGRYELYETFDEVPDHLLDFACPACFRGVTSLRALLSSPGFRQRILDGQRARVERAVEPSQASSPGAPSTEQSPPDPVVRWRGTAGQVIEAWCSRQLDLDSGPPDARGVLRVQVTERLRQLHTAEGLVLSAAFIAPQLAPGSDVENVLFTNIDATGSAFRNLARDGVMFEFWPEDPSTARGTPRLGYCSVYESVRPGRPSLRWRDLEVLTEWAAIPVPSLRAATSCGPVWWDLRRGQMTVRIPRTPPEHFGVHLALHVPVGEVVNAAAKVKVAVDASVLSLCCDNGTSYPEGMASLRAVFGRCRAVDKRGQANPPDSGCVQGSLFVVPDKRERWALTGRVVRLRHSA